MKGQLVASLAIILCATNVFGAPSAVPTTSGIDPDIIEEVVAVIQCTDAAIKKNIAGTAHEGSYDDCEAVFEKSVVNARKCGELDIGEGIACLISVSNDIVGAYVKFLAELSIIDAEFAENLDESVKGECQLPEFSLREAVPIGSTSMRYLSNHFWSLKNLNVLINKSKDAESLIETIRCMNSTIVQFLSGSGHEQVYVKYERAFKGIIERLQNCGNSDRCIFKEMIRIIGTSEAFFEELSMADSELTIELKKLVVAECQQEYSLSA